MKEELRCLARIKVRGKWRQCKHAQDHGGRHVYYTKKDGHRFFTESQARYLPVDVMKVKRVDKEVLRRMYEPHPMPLDPSKVTRVPVKYDFTGLNWDFIQLMAEIVPYADDKYTSFAQYTHARLTKQASPLNHIIAHAKQFMTGVPYDHFDGKPERHLAAIAYNAMMEFYYVKKFGFVKSPLALDVNEVTEEVLRKITSPDDLIAKKRQR